MKNITINGYTLIQITFNQDQAIVVYSANNGTAQIYTKTLQVPVPQKLRDAVENQVLDIIKIAESDVN